MAFSAFLGLPLLRLRSHDKDTGMFALTFLTITSFPATRVEKRGFAAASMVLLLLVWFCYTNEIGQDFRGMGSSLPVFLYFKQYVTMNFQTKVDDKEPILPHFSRTAAVDELIFTQKIVFYVIPGAV